MGASCDNDAKDRVTDTLTWKSSNTKVASVKANAGTYTATFKALQQGTTTITEGAVKDTHVLLYPLSALTTTLLDNVKTSSLPS